ncbi:MAG TPA: MarR family transcriptional regulator [Nocardioidaceae bacterium]
MNPEAPWLTARQEQVWRRWLSLNALLPAALHRALQADGGLSLPDFEVLVHLTDTPAGRMRVSDLAKALEWEKSRASHHVTRMERRGLIRREECPEDARGAFVVVTPTGQAAIERAAPGHARTVRQLIFDHLTDEELDSLEAITRKVHARLESVSATHG